MQDSLHAGAFFLRSGGGGARLGCGEEAAATSRPPSTLLGFEGSLLRFHQTLTYTVRVRVVVVVVIGGNTTKAPLN